MSEHHYRYLAVGGQYVHERYILGEHQRALLEPCEQAHEARKLLWLLAEGAGFTVCVELHYCPESQPAETS